MRSRKALLSFTGFQSDVQLSVQLSVRWHIRKSGGDSHCDTRSYRYDLFSRTITELLSHDEGTVFFIQLWLTASATNKQNILQYSGMTFLLHTNIKLSFSSDTLNVSFSFNYQYPWPSINGRKTFTSLLLMHKFFSTIFLWLMPGAHHYGDDPSSWWSV